MPQLKFVANSCFVAFFSLHCLRHLFCSILFSVPHAQTFLQSSISQLSHCIQPADSDDAPTKHDMPPPLPLSFPLLCDVVLLCFHRQLITFNYWWWHGNCSQSSCLSLASSFPSTMSLTLKLAATVASDFNSFCGICCSFCVLSVMILSSEYYDDILLSVVFWM